VIHLAYKNLYLRYLSQSKIYIKSLTYYLFLSFFLLIALLCFSCNGIQQKSIAAKQGVITTFAADFESDGALALKGEWEFYWKQYLGSGDFEKVKDITFVKVPDSWTNYEIEKEKKMAMEGYATYRLRVKIPAKYVNTELLGIKIPIISTAYQLFIQGRLISEPRKLGTSAQTTEGQYDPDIYYFMPRQQIIEIIFHVANYNNRISGLAQPPLLGKATQIRSEYENGLIVTFLLIGLMFVIGCYHVSLYIFRKKEIATLYFAIFCFVISLRSFVTDDYYLTELLPQSDFELGNKISYLTFYFSVPVFIIFIRSLYPQDFSIHAVRAILGISAVFSVIVLFSDGIFYSQMLVYYQLATVFIILYALYFIVILLLKRREESRTFAFGAFAIFFAAINDILVANLVFGIKNLIPAGLFIFIFSQTFIISRKFSRAYKKTDDLAGQLKLQNNELEITVNQRSQELGEANEELSQNVEELKTNFELISEQKNQIQAQHESITASITYAKNIQRNILPNDALFTELFPDNFLIFKPKGIVSGDFYYFSEVKEKIIVAAVDCTGHGVPGAFMSFIGYSILNEIIENHDSIEPAYILQELNYGVRKLLGQGEEASTSRDGMDIALVSIDKAKREIKFAGAKNPLVYLRNGEINTLSGDNIYIGGNISRENVDFTQTVITLSEDEPFSFYLFSDGYQDQFGGEENGKLMKKHFRELLYQIHQMPMQEQGELLLEWHEAWKGNLAQTDDILVMGIRL